MKDAMQIIEFLLQSSVQKDLQIGQLKQDLMNARAATAAPKPAPKHSEAKAEANASAATKR